MLRLAILIGIGSYQPGIAPLVNPARDAEALAALLDRDFGFRVECLLDHEATRQTIEKTLRTSLAHAEGAAQWLLFFAGHGEVVDDQGYLIPADACDRETATYLPVSWLREQCLQSRCREILIILDTCHAGQFLVRDEELSCWLSQHREANRRVRQILCSGNPDQMVLDGGGGEHSVFTACLLDGLEGWGGIHEADGSVRLSRLLDFLVAETDRRLTGMGSGSSRQQTIGGYFAGNAEQREFVFRTTLSRIPPDAIEDLRASDPRRRIGALAVLAEAAKSAPETLPLAVRLAMAHAHAILPRASSEPQASPVERREREQIAQTLGDLAALAERAWGPARLPDPTGEMCQALLGLSLDDESAGVRDRARAGLAKLGPIALRKTAEQLAVHRRDADRRLRRRAWEAVVCLEPIRRTLPLSRRWRAPFTRGRLLSGRAWRFLTATPVRRRSLAAPFSAALLLYMGLGSVYYFSSFNGSVAVRAGHPGFKALPLVGIPLVVTDHGLGELADPRLVQGERLWGSWLRPRGGMLPWAEQLFDHFPPARAALAHWRTGEADQALAQLREGVSAGDPAASEILAYLAVQSPAAATPALDLLVEALQREPAMHSAARAALELVRDARPEATAAYLGTLLHRLRTAASTDSRTLLEAIEILGHGEAARSVGAIPLAPHRVAVETLVKTVQGEDSIEVRSRAAATLSELRDPAVVPVVVTTLEKAAGDRSEVLRQQAVSALVELALDQRLDARRIRPTLRAALEDRSPSVRQEAAQGLLLLAERAGADLAPALMEVVRALTAEDWRQAMEAERLAPRFARASTTAGRIAIAGLGIHARSADLLRGDRLFTFLGKLAEVQPALLPDIAGSMADLLAATTPDSDARGRAVQLLWSLRTRPAEQLSPAVERILQRLRSPSSADRRSAAEALWALSAGDERISGRVAMELVPALLDPELEVRTTAAEALGYLGESQEALAPQLLAPLSSGLAAEPVKMRTACAGALARIAANSQGFGAVASPLLGTLRDPEPHVRRLAAAALAHWGRRALPHQARGTVPLLRERLAQDPDPEVRAELGAALAVLGGGDPEIATEVLRVAGAEITGPDARRITGIRILEALGESHPAAAGRALEAVKPLLNVPEREVWFRALIAIREIGMANPASAGAAVAVLEPALSDPDHPGRWDVIANGLEPLCRFQPVVAKDVVRTLRKLLQDPSLSERPEHRLLVQAAWEVTIKAGTLLAGDDPEILWPLLTSAAAGERGAAREMMVHLVVEQPELGPAFLERLARYRTSFYPHVRESAAIAGEMLTILQRTTEARRSPATARRWRAVLNRLPRVGIDAAVNLAKDQLEPGFKHS